MDLRFRKCTFFLVRKKTKAGGRDSSASKLCGTCFAISMTLTGRTPTQDSAERDISYAVTAAHVINKTKPDEDLYIRVNSTAGGTYDIPAPVSDWKRHPVSDIAACAIDWPEGVTLDVMTIPLDKLPTPETPMRSVCEGEEVTIVGLLTPFSGNKAHPANRSAWLHRLDATRKGSSESWRRRRRKGGDGRLPGRVTGIPRYERIASLCVSTPKSSERSIIRSHDSVLCSWSGARSN